MSSSQTGQALLSNWGLASLADVVLLAQQCIRSGNWDQAREICAAGSSQFGPDPALDVTLAMVELGNGNASEAETLLQRVREYCPHHLVALYTAAWMSIERGQPESALPDLLEVVRRFPDYPGALGTLASVICRGQAIATYFRTYITRFNLERISRSGWKPALLCVWHQPRSVSSVWIPT